LPEYARTFYFIAKFFNQETAHSIR